MDVFEVTKQVAARLYRRIYRITLTFSPENVDEALRVYAKGVLENLGIVEALVATYGYRYRRMENFIRELGLWKPRQGWLLLPVAVRIYSEEYETVKKIKGRRVVRSTVKFELSFLEYAIESVTYHVEREFAVKLLSLAVDRAGFPQLSYLISEDTIHIGIDKSIALYRPDLLKWNLDCRQKIEGDLTIEIGDITSRTYRYAVRFTMRWFSLHGVRVPCRRPSKVKPQPMEVE